MVPVIVFFVFLEILPGVFSQTGPPADTICKPYRATIFWDTYTEEYGSFFYQRILTVRLIDEMPDNSVIRLKVVGTAFSRSLHFTKDHSNTSWVERIAEIETGYSSNHTISYEFILDEIFDILNMNMAEEFFWVVNECSVIEEKKVREALKRKKTFVAVTGQIDKPVSNVWTSIATDKNHTLKLNYKGHTNLDEFLNLACKDSRLNCDTDMYWDGNRCHRCSYICSKVPSEYCRNECPYKEFCDSLNPAETKKATENL
ncbi:uncharacterized protein LOC123549819 [Mercenaria mercenaria]|uniref:uncharacterized protein LOC123549819 n=1 Tax=Mercenaria mercenaria TaxID=6596 RepID=UPI00234E5602|nr:uncharacterized protein LOC123549819 [Mercenaria mercenaria]